MVWGAYDHGGNASGHTTYRESDSLFDRFIRHNGIFRHNYSRPLLHAHYAWGVMTECRHPENIQGQRRDDFL